MFRVSIHDGSILWIGRSKMFQTRPSCATSLRHLSPSTTQDKNLACHTLTLISIKVRLRTMQTPAPKSKDHIQIIFPHFSPEILQFQTTIYTVYSKSPSHHDSNATTIPTIPDDYCLLHCPPLIHQRQCHKIISERSLSNVSSKTCHQIPLVCRDRLFSSLLQFISFFLS